MHIKKVIIPIEYLELINVFLEKLVANLSKYLNIIIYAIKLKKDKQLFYKSIYKLRYLELKTVKIYIEINLANNFIQ